MIRYLIRMRKCTRRGSPPSEPVCLPSPNHPTRHASMKSTRPDYQLTATRSAESVLMGPAVGVVDMVESCRAGDPLEEVYPALRFCPFGGLAAFDSAKLPA